MKTDFALNGTHRFIDKPPSTTLLELVRDEFKFQSVHPGCRKGHCGTCTVLLDDHLAASCMVPIFHLKGRRVETVEYLMESPEFRDLELGFLKAGFHPCKFCAGVKVLTAEAILREWEHPKEADMALFITKTWCPCTSPSSFFSAVIAGSEFRERRSHAHRR